MAIRSYTLQTGAAWLTPPTDTFRANRDGGWTRVVVSPDGRAVTHIYQEGGTA